MKRNQARTVLHTVTKASVYSFTQGSPVPAARKSMNSSSRRSGANGSTPVAVATKPKKKQKSCMASCCLSCCCGRRKGGGVGGAQVVPGEDSDEEATADAKAFISSIKQLTGLGEDDPEEVSHVLTTIH